MTSDRTADVAVIGAGAAGLMAALHAARAGADVVLLESTKDGGRKILISGGGRCNILPSVARPERYVTDSSPNSLRKILRSWPLAEQRAFFERELEMPLELEPETGKLFPSSHRARDVRDTLVRRVREAGARIWFDARVTGLAPVTGGWRIDLPGAPALLVRRAVVATGGLSVPNTGSDGAGINMVRDLGHRVNPTYPALTPLTADPHPHAALAGVSGTVTVSAPDARPSFSTTGGFLVTHRGWSGPTVLDASHLAIRGREGGGRQELLVSWTDRDAAWWDRALRDGSATVRSALAAHLPRRLADQLIEEAGVTADTPLAQLRKDDRRRVVDALTAYRLPWTGDEGYKKAEVTGGGVDLAEVDPATMESRRAPGLHLCGEILDAFGPIGGHNFLWAWATGRAAGEAAARAVLAATAPPPTMRLLALVLWFCLAAPLSGQRQESVDSIMRAVVRPAPVARVDDRSLPPRSAAELRGMLAEGRFVELEAYFESLAFQVTRDIRREADLARSYLAFQDPDPDRSADFERWTSQAYRRSAVPFVARSLFLSGQAMVAAREGDDELRRVLFEQARDDAARAREMAPDDLGAYLADALAGATVFRWGERDETVLRRGLQRFPASLVLREAVVAPNPAWLRPDTATFRRIVSDAEAHVGANPALATLRSRLAVANAWEWMRLDRPDAAVRVLADQPEGLWHVHLARGWALHSDHDHRGGLDELNRALSLATDHPSVLALRGAVLVQVGNDVPVAERRVVLDQAMADAVDARAAAPLANHENVYAAWAIDQRNRCALSTVRCWAIGLVPDEGHDVDPDEAWQMALLFLVSVPITLVMVVFQGNELALLAAPLIVAVDLGWNAIEWRRQRYWTPRVIHFASAAGVATLVAVNVAWVRAGGEMWVQRYVVIATVAVVPHMIYLILAGPRILRRLGRVPADRLPGSDVSEPLPQAPTTASPGPMP